MKIKKIILYLTTILGIAVITYFAYTYTQLDIQYTYTDLRKYSLGILLGFTIMMLGIFGLLSHLERINYPTIHTFSFFATPFLIVMLLTSWLLIDKTAELYDPEATIVTNQEAIDAYIATLKKEYNEQPLVTLPTGIFLYSLEFPKSDQVAFSGYFWQKYSTEQKKLDHGIRLPEAIELKINKAYKETEQNTEIIGWDIDATLFQEHDFALFPFDIRRVEIPLAHKTFGKNIVLVPDFSDYTQSAPKEKIALDAEYKIPGYQIEKTFFSFEPAITQTTFGLQSYAKIKYPVDLVYNIVISRNLLNAFILYLLPLLVILLSLYAVFLVSGRAKPGQKPRTKDIFKPLGPYVGLFFTLVFLHRFLRSQYTTGGLLYIEYFIFFTYITILLLVLHACTLRSENYLQRRIFPLFKPLFWPIQLFVWFITTITCFFP